MIGFLIEGPKITIELYEDVMQDEPLATLKDVTSFSTSSGRIMDIASDDSNLGWVWLTTSSTDMRVEHDAFSGRVKITLPYD